MKMFDWLNLKPRKKNQAEIQATEIHQQSKNASLLELHAAVRAQSVMKLGEAKGAAAAGLGFDSLEQPKKRHEIVKIFVNHEEYGLLAIGTLGLYDLTEIELFEVKPSALQPDHYQKQELNCQQQQQKLESQEPINEDARKKKKQPKKKKRDDNLDDRDQSAGVLSKDSKATTKRKLFSLDPHLRAALLHPLNHLAFSSSSSRSRKNTPCNSEIQNNHGSSKEKTRSSTSLLKKLLVGKSQSMSSSSSSSMKQITIPTSSSEAKATSTPSRSTRCQSKLKKAMSQFSCMSVQVEQDSDDDADDSSDDDSQEGGARSLEETGALSTPGDSSAQGKCSAPGDPNAGHQQTCNRDTRPEYWIRTDSDYVVLEL